MILVWRERFMNQEKIGKFISKCRRDKNMTQSELCEKTGIPKSAMSQYVSGAFTPKQERTYLIAKALNVNTKDVDFAILTDRRKAILSLDNICESDHKNLNFEEMIPVQDYKEASNIADAKLILELVIARLPKEYRKLIEMYYYQDLKCE